MILFVVGLLRSMQRPKVPCRGIDPPRASSSILPMEWLVYHVVVVVVVVVVEPYHCLVHPP
jgi:hypothetical protein